MKKLINAIDQVENQMVTGMAKAYPQYLRKLDCGNVVVRADKKEGKVALISGGGSGHEPAHGGYVGTGMLDAAVAGAVFTSPTPDQIYEGIKAIATDKGVLMVIKNYTGDVMNFEMAREMAEMEGIKVDQVVVNDDVAVDNSQGTFLGTEYLYSLGHREILYFGRRRSTTHQLRAEGYMRACQELGLKQRFYNSEFARSSIEYGYQMAKDLFAQPIDYTAIFASTDSNALGILKAADELGIKIPDQLSLIGFDNIPSTALPRIDLTTIEQPKRAMAVQAVDMLLDKIERGTQGYVHQIMSPSLIQRGTCRSLL